MARIGSLTKTGAIAGVTAALATTGLAAIAKAADVSLEVDAVPIPTGAFAMWTVVGAVLGIGLALLLRTRRRFLIATATGFAFSLVPAIAFPGDAASKAVLVAAHAVAAAIIVSPLARQLTVSSPHRGHE